MIRVARTAKGILGDDDIGDVWRRTGASVSGALRVKRKIKQKISTLLVVKEGGGQGRGRVVEVQSGFRNPDRMRGGGMREVDEPILRGSGVCGGTRTIRPDALLDPPGF